MSWTPPQIREHRTEEHGAYSELEGGYWVMVLKSGAVVCGKDAEVMRLPAGAAEAVVACKTFANRKAK